MTVVNDTNPTFGANLKLRVLEKTQPAVVISSPTEGQITSNTRPVLNFTITDSGSGVDPSTIGIFIDSGSKVTGGITKNEITNGYICSYSLSEILKDGTHTLYAQGADFDGNASVKRAVNFTVDTVPPELSVQSPVNNLVTNNPKITVSGIASDVTSKLESVTVRLNGGQEENIEVLEGGSFSKEITISDGANTIVVTATDKGGMQSSVTRVVTLDQQAPVIKNITVSPNPVSTGELLTVSADVED